MSVLNPQDKFIVWSLVNFYEFTIGFLLGLTLNEVSYMIAPFKDNENILTTLTKMNNEKIILQQRARETLYPLGT